MTICFPLTRPLSLGEAVAAQAGITSVLCDDRLSVTPRDSVGRRCYCVNLIAAQIGERDGGWRMEDGGKEGEGEGGGEEGRGGDGGWIAGPLPNTRQALAHPPALPLPTSLTYSYAVRLRRVSGDGVASQMLK